MRIYVRTFREFEVKVDVPENISVIDFKRKLVEITGDYSSIKLDLFFNGFPMFDDEYLRDFHIKNGDRIFQSGVIVAGGPELENSDYSTNIHAVNKRENIGREYYYKIKGSSEGTVWGDNIYTDDSNIAKAAVLEGKCQLGQEKIVGIKMIEGKSSYSSASRYGVSSVTYGSWPASYIFTNDV
jgi:hypothetical protein